MFRLTYKDTYLVERVQEFEDLESLMLSLSGCVTLPDTTVITIMERKSIRGFWEISIVFYLTMILQR